MAKKERYSVSDIAEILIDEIENFKSSAETLRQSTNKLAQTKVVIDEESFARLINLLKRNKEEQQAFIEKIESINKENSLRLPNWVTGALIALIITITTFSVITYKKTKQVDYLNFEIQYYKSELEKYTANE